jgi:tetratricopeptide (TPR) repeat protein
MQPMAAIDPYSLCPCGSGEKFKWCCHKVESYAERAQKLLEGGQTESALKALEEGLGKDPGNAWLLTRKTLVLLKLGRPEEARSAVGAILKKNPKHLGGLVLATRLALETEGPAAGAAQLQQAMSAMTPVNRKSLGGLARVVGAFLTESGDFPAALQHLRLADELFGGPDPGGDTVKLIEGNASISPWLKDTGELSPAPEGLAGEARGRFAEALGWASEGLWSSAASAFETLRSDPVAGPAAERNLGLCRLWLADDEAAAAALRGSLTRLGATEEAVDLEALCQQIESPGPDDQVEHVQLTWPLRDRDALLGALKADKAAHDEGAGPLDPDDPASPEVDEFALLDRPAVVRSEGSAAEGSDLTPEQVPRVLGRVYVGKDSAVLETFDDGRLDGLSERFTALAGASIAPAHPRTKVLDKVSRLQLALSWEWLLPDGTDPRQALRLKREQGARMMREVWPNTPMRFLLGRTPLQAAEAGDAEVPLRAAAFQLEHSEEPWRDEFDFAALRERLRLRPEPEPNPETVDVEKLHLSRLALVPADRLSDEQLGALYRRARRFMVRDAIDRAARAVVQRPEALPKVGVDSLTAYSDLVTLAAGRGRTDEAAAWVRRGRQADTGADRVRNAPHWEMLEIRLRAQAEEPATWVPELAAVLDRYEGNDSANETVIVNLIEMGLVQVVTDRGRPGHIYLDSRPLQALFQEYGPRVTTATGRLGVSATKPAIWTPGSEAGPSGGLWTPGAAAQKDGGGGGGGTKLIIPGR